ncbi:MAG: hypothetical protein IT559_06770 [Alphaproteobacteria bacterium]|nr:hypothetical protein [Alphaproteobacteria bacterium]
MADPVTQAADAAKGVASKVFNMTTLKWLAVGGMTVLTFSVLAPAAAAAAPIATTGTTAATGGATAAIEPVGIFNSLAAAPNILGTTVTPDAGAAWEALKTSFTTGVEGLANLTGVGGSAATATMAGAPLACPAV